jgi:CBS domain-containing protein
MNVGAICTRLPERTTRLETVRRAAEQMVAHDVGALVVTDRDGRAEGFVTDRDLVVRCIVEGRSPEETTVAEVMSAAVTTVREDAMVETALDRMANEAVRCLAVVDDADHAVGIVTLDDMLGGIIEEAEEGGRLLQRRVYS